MSENAVRSIIEGKLDAEWSLTSIDWDGVRFNPINGVAYITPIIDGKDTELKSFGCKKRFYTLLIEVYVPYNKGTALANSYCDLLLDMFEGYEEGQFWCKKGYVVRVGKRKNWYQKNVILQCEYKQVT